MDFLESKITQILKSQKGVKCLLFDEITKPILSTLIPHSRFLDNDFFLIEEITAKRQRLNLNCVCVLDPRSIKIIIKEVTDPVYVSYTLLFTNTIDLLLLNILAKNDIFGVVEEIHEIYMDYSLQDNKLYLLTGPNSLNSFIYSLGYRPTFYYLKRNDLDKCEMLTSQGGRIFVLNREYDQITPLIIDWCYQSMIKKYCDYNNKLVKINNKTFCLEDDFFEENKFLQINEVASNLENLIKKLDLKKKIKKLNITEIEEINNLSELVNKHMKIYKHIVQDLKGKSKISELENLILINKKKHKKLPEELRNNLSIHLNKLNELTSLNYEIKSDEDIKLSYVPPIRKLVKNILKNKKTNWICPKERFNKQNYTIFYFLGGMTFTEYRHMMDLCSNLENLYILTDKIL